MNLFIGVDIGTSGVRAVCIDEHLHEQALAAIAFAELGWNRTDPNHWAAAVTSVLKDLLSQVSSAQVKAIAIDGTSGTMIVTDAGAEPLSPALMYNDTCDNQRILDGINSHAPDTSAVHGATSGLAKAIQLSAISGAACIQHEADWIAAALSGRRGLSDENNALKTGYDPVNRAWPDWIDATGMNRALLPTVLKAGEPIGAAKGWLANQVGLPASVLVVAGTTDGCASFLATGASEPGDGVSVWGSTLTIKLLSDKPIYAPEFGIYSHRIADTWLAGGASNTGGKVLERYFTPEMIEQYTGRMNANVPTGLDYYPLITPGERFPINDSALAPRLEPRPASDALFLQGLLEGMANIEKLAYSRLSELGGTQPRSIRSVGGGANNSVFTQIRQHALPNIPFADSLSAHAATGTAVLAKRGAADAGVLS